MVVAFSLSEPIAYDKICKRIDEMLKKEIKSQEQAQKSVLVISVQSVSEQQEIKRLE